MNTKTGQIGQKEVDGAKNSTGHEKKDGEKRCAQQKEIGKAKKKVEIGKC